MDADEHLKNLAAQMASEGSIDEEDYKVQIAYAYAHLNRAWSSRDFKGTIEKTNWEKFSIFPNDIEPIA